MKNRNVVHALLGALTMLIALTLSILTGQMAIGVMSAFGALLYMYYVPEQNGLETFNHFYFISAISAGSFIISAFIATIPWLTVIWIGMLAFSVSTAIMRSNFKGPGIFFVLVINGMLSSLVTLSLLARFMLSLYAILGIVIAFLCALIENQIYDHYSLKLNEIKGSFSELNYQIISKSLVNAVFIGLAYYIGLSLHLGNYYWVLIGAMTILKEEQTSGGLKKQLQCVGAAAVGCVISVFIYAFVDDTTLLIILAILLMFIINYLMPYSYLFANFFTTPIGLILFKLFHNAINYSLIYSRLIYLVVGTTVGLLGLIFYERLFRQIDN